MPTVSSSREYLVVGEKADLGDLPYYCIVPSFLHSQCALCSENFLPRQVV